MRCKNALSLYIVFAACVLSCSYQGDEELRLTDPHTAEDALFHKVTVYSDGSPMTQEKCDGVLYIERDGLYYRRIVGDRINVKWFGAKGDGDPDDLGTDDTKAIKFALSTVSKVYKPRDLSGGNLFGGITLFFPSGMYLVSETLIIPDAVTIEGESRTNTAIHMQNPKFIFTNVRGFEANGTDMLMSSAITIKNITLKQGGIELQGAYESTIENIRILNLFGDNIDQHPAISIKLSVNLNIKDVKISNSTGYGILFEDTAGTGPSTTVTLDGVWVAHCKVGLKFDGHYGGSHGILNAGVYNSIFEYNEVGAILTGNIENLAFRDIHFEQNEKDALQIFGNVNTILENIWSDKGNVVIKAGHDADVSRSTIYITNMNVPKLVVDRTFKGRIYRDGKRY